MVKIKDDPKLEAAFKDWLGWNEKPPPEKDDPDYYTYSWGLNVWINAARVYESKLEKVREVFGEVWACKGCSCCADIDGLEKAAEQIGELLDVEKYDDDSGFDFWKYRKGKEAGDV